MKNLIKKMGENISKRKINMFGIEIKYMILIPIILFFVMAIINIYVFIQSLIALNFYLALVEIGLFSMNVGLIYYNWTVNKFMLVLDQHKT